MPRAGSTHLLAARSADASAHQQLNTGGGNAEQTLTLNPDCVALMISVRTNNAYVTFNNVAASASNGLELIAGAQPIYIPLGYQANSAHVLRAIGTAASTILNVLQLA